MITCVGLSPALDVTYLVEKLEPGSIHRPRQVIALPGGKSLNVARAARVLGADVVAIAPLGGHTGVRIGSALDTLGLDVRLVPVKADSRVCVSVFDESDHTITEFYEPTAQLSAAEAAGVLADVEQVDQGWIALSGSIAETVDLNQLAAALAAATRRGVRVAIDTHGSALRTLLELAAPALVKVNRSEAAALLGSGTAADLAVRLASQLGEGATAIVTDGPAGAVASGELGLIRATPAPAGPFTVGSGDCFLAGLLTALDLDGGLDDALTLATAAAAANTLGPGAALLRPDEVQALLATVVVSRSNHP